MTKDEYLKVRSSRSADSMELIHFYYLTQGGVVQDLEMYRNLFSKWLLSLSFGAINSFKERLGRINLFVIVKLDEYFKNL